MSSEQIVHLIRTALGQLDTGWEVVSGHTAEESFTIIRLDGAKKGELRRIHALIEDLLSREIGEGERV